MKHSIHIDFTLNRFILTITLAILFFSCKSSYKKHSILQKEESIQFFDDQHFKYKYYNIFGYGINDLERFYSEGTYERIGKNIYKLKFSHFNPDSINREIKMVGSNDLNRKTKLVLDTNILSDFSSQFVIEIKIDSLNFNHFGTNIDTLVNLQNEMESKKCVIEIKLPDFYLNGHPKPLFSKLKTKPFEINNPQEIFVKVPVSLEHFFYKEFSDFKIEDRGKYFVVVDSGVKRKIKKIE